MENRITAWILDSGGAGRGAWQGGVIHEFMEWARANGCYPQVSMGASAGGFAAGDVATGTERTVMKGWTAWGTPELVRRHPLPSAIKARWPRSRFRETLYASIGYVMAETEVDAVFDGNPAKKLLIFTTRVRRRDRRPLRDSDLARLFTKSLTRKFPRALKYLPAGYVEDPVIFALNLPAELASEFARPLTRQNYHRVIEASCLVPLAMGPPIRPEALVTASVPRFAGDDCAVFIDGGYALKMPMAVFAEDSRFARLSEWAAADRTVIFCCDPRGHLWETSSRLRQLESHPSVARAVAETRLLVIYPDHKVEAGFLCLDNHSVMRTFRRGQEQGRRLLGRDDVRRFFLG